MRQRIRQGLNEFPDAIRDLRVTMDQFRVVLESANRNFRNLEGFTEPLGRRGEEIATSVVDAVDGLDRLVEEFTVLSQALNSREGTLGQLIHNPQLYENLNRLVHNANQVIVQINDLTLRLRPIANDARVFMDKVAREPGRVVTGGLSPSLVK
jgi:phospholipid/cholesterol/gamma-HCH transport system substrate-binding protein